MTPEGKIKAAFKREFLALEHAGFKVYLFMPVQMGFGYPALDYFCCCNGHFIAVETKAPGKKMTFRQELTAQAIQDGGGLFYLIDSINKISPTIISIRLKCSQM